MDENLARLVEVYTYLSALYQVGLDVTDEEGDAPSNDIFMAAKTDAEKTIWIFFTITPTLTVKLHETT